jgi:hypothetical protein
MPTKNKVIKQLNTVLLLRDKAASGLVTTTTGATAAGVTSLPVAGVVNAAVGDAVRVGIGDQMEVGIITNTASPLIFADPLTYPHAAGDPVVSQTAYDLGDVSDSGVTITTAGNATYVPVSTRRLNFATLDGYLEMRAEFSLPTASLYNFAFATGVPLSAITGNGATITPFAFNTDGNAFGTELNQSLIAIGTRMDGTTVRIEMWNVDFDYTAYTMRLARGVVATTPFRCIASAGGVITDNASAYAKATTFRPTKAKVFDYLQEVGIFVDETTAPITTTSTGTAAAGQPVLAIAAGAPTAGMWFRVGAVGSSEVEYHRVSSFAALNITFVDNLVRAQAAGTPVVQQKLVPLSGITEQGVTFSIGGAVDMLRSAVSRLAVGMKPGDASPVVTLSLMDISLVNFAYAMGIPQAAIVGGRLPMNVNIATSSIDGFYLRGILQSGEQSWITCWGCEQDVSSIATQIAARGVAAIPLSLRPASGVGFLQHT